MFCRKLEDFMFNRPFFLGCEKSAEECDGVACHNTCGGDLNIGGEWTTVVVGFPWYGEPEAEFPPFDLHTETRFLPKILVELGFFPSNSAAIRQCKDWKVEFPPDVHLTESIRLAKNGKRKNQFVEIIIGPAEKPDVKCSKPSRAVVLGQSWDTFCGEITCPHCWPQEDLDFLWRMRHG